MTETALERLVELLEKGSPLLIHGCFTRAVPMGCLASHIAWNHPETAHLTVDAGITWLHRVAALNPATSAVLREWDRRGVRDLDLRSELQKVFQDELSARRAQQKPHKAPACLARV
jgi:hypothetical protein